jgi:hypothetical protein
VVAALSIGGVDPPAPDGSVPVAVSIDAHHPAAPVPRRFLGLSFELSNLPQIARYAYRGDFVSMLRSLGPGVLRFGGVSADTRVAWTDSATPRPAWGSAVLSPGDLRELGKLAARQRDARDGGAAGEPPVDAQPDTACARVRAQAGPYPRTASTQL